MKVLVLDGGQAGATFPLEGDDVLVGRHSTAQVRLTHDSRVSRRHCLLRQLSGQWLVEDLGSENGTRVAGQRVVDREPLPVRTVFQVGHTRLVMLEDDEPIEPVLSGGLDSDKPVMGTTQVVLDVGPSLSRIEATLLASAEDPRPTSADPKRLQQRLQALQEVTKAMSGKLEPVELLEAVLSAVLNVVPAQRGFVLTVAEGGTEVNCVAAQRPDGSQPGDLRLSSTLLRRAIDERVGLLVADTAQDVGLAEAQSVALALIRSALTVPLVDQDEVVAVLHLDTDSVRAFTSEDLELLVAMARQAELAIANTRLYAEVRVAYEELKLAQDRLVQAEKLTAIGTLAASIAHDVGNVLTPIRAIARKVMRDDTLDPRLREAFERQMQRLQALTQQLLSFSRPAPPALVPLDLNAQVMHSLELVTTEARHANVKVSTALTEGLPQVLADGNRLDQVLINLCINALHAMKHTGGSLTLATRTVGENVVLDVTDTGCGMEPAVLVRIFDAFFTTKGAEGTGMGLHSCKRIVEEEHGGQLLVRSAPGKGTTFSIVLSPAPGDA